MKTAIVPGTFDPITLGHMAVIEYASKKYDVVYVTSMDNPEKSPVCDSAKRVELICKCVEGISNVKAVYRSGMLYEFVKELGGADIVKGIRNNDDLLYEKAMADYNERMCGAKTVYVPASDDVRNISSTLVKKAVAEGKSVSGLVPKAIEEDIQKLYGGNAR